MRRWQCMRRGDMSDREIELMKRIETEHTIFKYRMLASTAAEVYENCNVIRFYECIYEFFQYAEDIEKGYTNACLRYENIIGTLYQLYMKYEYLRYSRWEDIEELLSALVEEQKKYAEAVDCGKESG